MISYPSGEVTCQQLLNIQKHLHSQSDSLTEREVQCSLTAETRANGKVNFPSINIRPLSYYVMLGGEHYWKMRMRNCTGLTRPWMVGTSLMPLLTSLEG